MSNSSHDKDNDKITLTITNDELVDIHMALAHLVYTFDEQDSVLMGLPGKEGERRLNALQDKFSALLTSRNEALKGKSK